MERAKKREKKTESPRNATAPFVEMVGAYKFDS